MSRFDRIFFFSKDDGATGHMLEKVEKLLDHNPELSGMDINALLEFHHIHQYFEFGLFLSRWDNKRIKDYQTKVAIAMLELKAFFIRLESGSLKTVLTQLDFDNRKNFWELFRLYESYKRINRNLFASVLTAQPEFINNILKLKQVVDYFKLEIRDFLLTYHGCGELLLSHYEENHDEAFQGYYFPKMSRDSCFLYFYLLDCSLQVKNTMPE
jgi:hypothetical protein